MSNPQSMFDSFSTYNTKNILYGNYIIPPNDLIKGIIVAVIKSYTIDAKGYNTNEWGKLFNELYENNYAYSYNDLASKIQSLDNNNKQPSAEYIMAAAMYGYKDFDSELLTRCLNTFCRPVKLSGREEWLDNWSLNGPGNALNFVFWGDYDSKDVVAIHKRKSNIQSAAKTNTIVMNAKQEGAGNNNKKVHRKNNLLITQNDIKDTFEGNQYVLKIVGVFRAFLICNGLIPGIKKDDIKNEYSADDIVTACVEHFPFYYLGCGGCDMFEGTYAADIETISSFLTRFPHVTLGSIINVSTFRSNDGGSHWMGLHFKDGKASLMCPQASSWDILADHGELKRRLINSGFSLENNLVCCQHDRCNCGVYSFLFLFMMLVKDGNMKEAIKQVGVNANNLYNNGENNRSDMLIYKVKNTLFGYE